MNMDEIKESEQSEEEEDKQRILDEVLATQEARKLAKLKLPGKKLPPVPQVKDLLAAHIQKKQKIPLLNERKVKNEEIVYLETMDLKSRVKRFQNHLKSLKHNIKKLTGKTVEEVKEERKFEFMAKSNKDKKHKTAALRRIRRTRE